MPSNQDKFFAAVASRHIPRIRVAGIVVQNDAILVQKPTDQEDACFAFIGGEYEIGDSFESRLHAEFEEETSATVVSSSYLFCVENHFYYKGDRIQQAEHYFQVTLDRYDIVSKEPHLSQHWVPIVDLHQINLRPFVVRDVLADGSYQSHRHLVQQSN